MKFAFGSLLAVALFSANVARAEEAHLYHAQSGALLAFADAEVMILFNALLAKEFDPEIVKGLLKDLERSVNDAKRSVDRTRIVLGDEKLEPEFVKLLDVIKRAESQVTRLSTDIEEQTGEKEEEPSDHRNDEEPEEPKKADWNLLKNDAAWLYQDIKDARAQHATVGKKLKGAPLKAPPKASGKRDQ
jgi:hypothetical protein